MTGTGSVADPWSGTRPPGHGERLTLRVRDEDLRYFDVMHLRAHSSIGFPTRVYYERDGNASGPSTRRTRPPTPVSRAELWEVVARHGWERRRSLRVPSRCSGLPRPWLTGYPWKQAPAWLQRLTFSPVTVWALRIAVLALFVLTLAEAAFGSTDLGRNVAPLVVFVVWWIGLVPLSVLAGNVWRENSPWTTMARLARMPERREGRPLPHWVGVWPAAAFLLAFGWFELVYPTPAEPRLLAGLIGVYSLATLAAMWRWGVATWLDHGEAFSVCTGLLALMSPVESRELDGGARVLGLRPPLIAATPLRPTRGVVA